MMDICIGLFKALRDERKIPLYVEGKLGLQAVTCTVRRSMELAIIMLVRPKNVSVQNQWVFRCEADFDLYSILNRKYLMFNTHKM
jgi:hypothetical protein